MKQAIIINMFDICLLYKIVYRYAYVCQKTIYRYVFFMSFAYTKVLLNFPK